MSEPMTPKMSQWESAEERCYQDWLVQHPNQTMQEYYQNERQKAVVVKGIVEQYNRPR